MDGREVMYEYNAKLLRIVDGDTLDMEVDLGFRTFQRIRCRLYGLNAPETFGVPRYSEEYAAGKAAIDFVTSWFATNNGPAGVVIRSYDGRDIGQEKYGRWLVVPVPPTGGVSLCDAMIAAGVAEAKIY
jgi:micrococcal nuclease